MEESFGDLQKLGIEKLINALQPGMIKKEKSSDKNVTNFQAQDASCSQRLICNY